MTTTVWVESHNYPAKVEVIDRTNTPLMKSEVVATRILHPGDGKVQFYCTTSRELRITDLEYDDPLVLEDKKVNPR